MSEVREFACCEICRFWNPEDHGDSFGQCTRFPPVVTIIPAHLLSPDTRR